MSHLDNGFRSLTLQRFPATDDVNPLQAWEAADEYLLQQLDDTEIRGPVLILNDAFGALSCALWNISRTALATHTSVNWRRARIYASTGLMSRA